MRLVYLDETGTTSKSPNLAVSGVIIHGDMQSGAIQNRLDEIVKNYIPQAERVGFVLHSTDIFHGSGYFHRDKWPQATRWAMLKDIGQIIDDFALPVVVSGYEKAIFGVDVIPESTPTSFKNELIQTAALLDCAVQADRWLAEYASNENAMLIAEDADRVKRLVKKLILVLRRPDRITQEGLSSVFDEFNLPLKRIIDTVHFAAKEDCAPLQIADFCAFCSGRVLNKKPVPSEVFEPVVKYARWIKELPKA